jgi:hypothetical protein
MESILQQNLNWARENNLPIAATYEKLLATPGGEVLYDHQYNINNWEDLAEGLAEQLVAEAEAKGTKDFILDNARAISYSGQHGSVANDFNNVVQTLNTLPLSSQEVQKVNSDIQQGAEDLRLGRESAAEFDRNFGNPGRGGFGGMFSDIGQVVQQLAANPVVQIGIAYYMPGVVQSFAPSLSAIGITNAATQTVVANAIASTAVQVASGVPINDALQNAVTNAVVSTGSPAIAKDINKVIDSPGVTNAIVSAGSSAAKTALNGGSDSDITNNLIAGLVGSGVATATDSNVAGAAAGGAVSGGVTGALAGAASAYGSQAAAEERAAKRTSEFVSGVNLAAADTGTVSDAGGGLSVEVSGTPIFADSSRAANVKTPFGFAVMPIEMADKKPEGAYYDYTQNAWIAPVTDIQKFTTMSPLASTSASAGRTSVAPGVDLTQPTTTTPSYNPNIISTGGITSYSGRNTTGIKVKPNITPSNKGTITGSNQQSSGVNVTGGGGTTPSLGTVNVTGRREETPSLDTVNVTGRREDIPSLDTVNVTGERENEIPSLDTVNVKATPDGTELPPVEDETGKPVTTYTPTIFTYGGVTTLPDTLTTTLTRIPTSKTTTGTSVGLGGRGEIESKESGKKRQNVWNEESLRLKDALGL